MLFLGLWLEASTIMAIAIIDASMAALDMVHEYFCERKGGTEKSPPFFVDKMQ